MTILQAVMQKLGKKPVTVTTTDQVVSLADKLQTLSPLFQLLEQRQLLEVVCERTGESFQTMILEIDLQHNYLLLDELFPEPSDLSHRPGDRFTIKHHQRGQLLCVTSELLSITLSTGSPVYTLVLPQEVSYQQRRSSQRLHLSREQPLTVKLQSPWRMPWYATANNISAGGMRVVVGGNVMDQLRIGCLLPSCEFSFHDEFTVRCQAIARSFRFKRRPYRHTEISLEFTDMAPQQRLQLTQFIEQLEHNQAA